VGVPRGWPLTGRAEELSRISGLTHRRDEPAGAVLAGAAGVGKTRLAREALAAAEQHGALTRWAVATASARALPLGAFAAMLGVSAPIRPGWYTKRARRCWPVRGGRV
jgi:AAA ATPase domain